MHDLRDSVSRWHEMLAEFLRDMGFKLCNMEPGTWLRPYVEDRYKHVSVYVDDLFIAFQDPKSTIDAATNKHSFKVKGKDLFLSS